MPNNQTHADVTSKNIESNRKEINMTFQNQDVWYTDTRV